MTRLHSEIFSLRIITLSPILFKWLAVFGGVGFLLFFCVVQGNSSFSKI